MCVFATSSFNFGLPAYFVSHYCYGRALHGVFYRRGFFFLSGAELFDWGTTRFKYRVSRITCVACFVLHMPLWFKSGIISSVEGIWLDVSPARSPFSCHTTSLLLKKIIYEICLIQAGRRIFLFEINNAKSTRPAQCEFGGTRAPFPNSGW